jgi:circadian clock protein KaiC
MRGIPFVEGNHDLRIATGGIRVFPRLVAFAEPPLSDRINTCPALTSGIKELDNLMGGPVPWRFGAMIVGPPGIGKSSLAAQFATSAAEHGKKVCMYLFEESMTTLLGRCESLGIGIAKHVKKGGIEVHRIAEAPPYSSRVQRRAQHPILDMAEVLLIKSVPFRRPSLPDRSQHHRQTATGSKMSPKRIRRCHSFS